MNLIIKPERATQNRIITLFRNELKYRYLGDWRDRPNNSNIEEEILTDYLKSRGYSDEQIDVCAAEVSAVGGDEHAVVDRAVRQAGALHLRYVHLRTRGDELRVGGDGAERNELAAGAADSIL